MPLLRYLNAQCTCISLGTRYMCIWRVYNCQHVLSQTSLHLGGGKLRIMNLFGQKYFLAQFAFAWTAPCTKLSPQVKTQSPIFMTFWNSNTSHPVHPAHRNLAAIRTTTSTFHIHQSEQQQHTHMQTRLWNGTDHFQSLVYTGERGIACISKLNACVQSVCRVQ